MQSDRQEQRQARQVEDERYRIAAAKLTGHSFRPECEVRRTASNDGAFIGIEVWVQKAQLDKLAPPMTFACMYCGVLVLAHGEEQARAAGVWMREHDAACSKNPILAQLRAVQMTVHTCSVRGVGFPCLLCQRTGSTQAFTAAVDEIVGRDA